MKPSRHFSKRFIWSVCCVAGLLVGSALSDLPAQTVYTWNVGTGSWSNGALWNTGNMNNTLDRGTLPTGYHYAIDLSMAGQVDLVITTVPEPATWPVVPGGIDVVAG